MSVNESLKAPLIPVTSSDGQSTALVAQDKVQKPALSPTSKLGAPPPFDVRVLIINGGNGSTPKSPRTNGHSGDASSQTTVVKVEDMQMPLLPEVSKDAPVRIFTAPFVASAAIVASTTTLQSITNSLLKSNNFSEKSVDGSTELMRSMAFAHFLNKMVKGNFTDVDSEGKQLVVLLAYIAWAVGSDCACYFIFSNANQTIVLGQASIIAMANSLTWVSAMVCGKILGKNLYVLGKTASKPKTLNKGPKVKKQKIVVKADNINCRRGSSGILVAGTAMGASLANRLFIDASSSMGTVLNMICSEMVNKEFKTGQGTEDKTSNKIKLLGFYCLTAFTFDVLMGAFISGGLSRSNPFRYFGATSAGAVMSFCKVSLKAASDHAHATENSAVAKCQKVAAAITIVAVPVITAIANRSPLVRATAALAWGISYFQHNATSLAVRELFKNATTTCQRTVVALAPVVIAAAVELAAEAIIPAGSLLLPATGIAVATAASYCGMTLSAHMGLGDGDTDDG